MPKPSGMYSGPPRIRARSPAPSIAAFPAGRGAAAAERRRCPRHQRREPEDLAATPGSRLSVQPNRRNTKARRGRRGRLSAAPRQSCRAGARRGSRAHGSMGGAKNNNAANSPVVLGTATQQVSASASATGRSPLFRASASAAASASVGGTATLAAQPRPCPRPCDGRLATVQRLRVQPSLRRLPAP